jgi:hypothetical protein
MVRRRSLQLAACIAICELRTARTDGKPVTGNVADMRENPVLAALGAYPIAELQALARSMRESGRAPRRLLDRRSGGADARVHPRGAAALRSRRLPVPHGARPGGRSARRSPPTCAAVSASTSTRTRRCCPPPGRRRPSSRRHSPSSIGMPGTSASSPHPAIRSTSGAFASPGPPPSEPCSRATSCCGRTTSRLRRRRAFASCGPARPTTRAVRWRPFADLASLYEWCRERDVLLLSDEPYTDLYGDTVPSSALEAAGPGRRACSRSSRAASGPG